MSGIIAQELVRSSGEETLNNILLHEAKELTNAARYERTEAWQGYRAGLMTGV